MQHFGVVYSIMQLKSDRIAKEVDTVKYVNNYHEFLAKFHKLCVRMALNCLPNRGNYWRKG